MLKMKTPSKHNRIYQWLILLILLAFLFSMAATTALAQENGIAPEEPRAARLGGVQPYAATAPTNSAGIASADPNGAHSVYGWPIVFNQMGHLIQSFQNYGSSAADSYFHHGVDLITNNYGVNVYAVSGGRVVNVQNYSGGAMYWEVAILDSEGYVWQYHHIDTTTIPQAIKDAFSQCVLPKSNYAASCGYIAPGTLIGKNVQWTVSSFGYYFHHIHLNILATGDVYINPLEFFNSTSYPDTQAPEIQAIGLLKNNTVTSGNIVTGNYGLYVQTRDLWMSSVYYLPPYKYEFALDGGDWTTVWEFHTFPGGSNDYTFVNDFFVYPPTCGNYSCRSFYVDLGFTTSGQRAFPSTPGQHNIQVCVWDYYGNTTCSSFDWIVAENIIDNGCSSGNGVTRTFNITDDIVISDVNLGINISHATRGQLKVTLQAPGDATATTIVNTSTDSHDNYDVLIDDSSGNPINDNDNDLVASPYYDRTAGPSTNGSLDSFNGVRALGTWTVFICDNTTNTTGAVNLVRLDLSGIPTAVGLKSFRATGSGRATTLSWETTSEINNLGFNLYRATSINGVRTKLNDRLIPTKVYPGSPFGAVYSYTDTSPRPKLPYYYWLENLDIFGGAELHGPIQLKTK